MQYREATIADIPMLFEVRMSVRENVLQNMDMVTEELCVEYLMVRGKGWVCLIDQKAVGFAITDIKDSIIWALFVGPEYQCMGIGKTLHDVMLDWYFAQCKEFVKLTTLPNTRAERFYRKAGWKEIVKEGRELEFELTKNDWLNSNKEQLNFDL